MMAGLLALALAFGAPQAHAQPAPETATAPEGAELRLLDRITGETSDLHLAPGASEFRGGLEITLGQCRYPVENPESDAFAHLTIREAGESRPVFDGWMIASSPALMALDHPRYDVWVIRCSISGGETPEG